MNQDIIKKLAVAQVSNFKDLSLEDKILSIRYAMEEAEITPDKLGQVLQELHDIFPEAADAKTVDSILKLFISK